MVTIDYTVECMKKLQSNFFRKCSVFQSHIDTDANSTHLEATEKGTGRKRDKKKQVNP